jgi:hypothetical protein
MATLTIGRKPIDIVAKERLDDLSETFKHINSLNK